MPHRQLHFNNLWRTKFQNFPADPPATSNAPSRLGRCCMLDLSEHVERYANDVEGERCRCRSPVEVEKHAGCGDPQIALGFDHLSFWHHAGQDLTACDLAMSDGLRSRHRRSTSIGIGSNATPAT